MGLTLIVDQMICPSNVHHVDTLSCKLIDERGNSLGVGLSYYQYHFPISTISLREADSIVVRIRHDMKRERSEEHTSELQSRQYLVCRLLLEKKKTHIN